MKLVLVLLVLTAIGIFYFSGGGEYFNFTYLKEHVDSLISYFDVHTVRAVSLFGLLYLFLTALSIPGSIILTILAGALFGTVNGAGFVTVLGTIGATLSFLMSRYLFRDYLTLKFHRQFKVFNHNISKEGLMYVLGVRLIPISPYVVVNTVLGLTEIKIWTFFWTTFLGMLPGNLIYVYAGTKLREFESLSDIMTPTFLLSLTALGILPFLVKKIIDNYKQKTMHA